MHPSRLGFARGLVLLVPACALAWAAGCSDSVSADPTPDAGASDAGEDAPAHDADADADAGATPDCSSDRAADGVHKHLECTGLYASFADKTLAPGVAPYKPGVEFWSDGADKHRWVYLPPGSKIDTTDFDEWRYPAGTKLWKEFKLGGKRVETRFYTKLDDGSWGHAAYRWNADETDAIRKDGGEKIPGIGLDGGLYEIPNTGLCDTCHMGRKDQVLGFDAVGLGLAGATGETLAKLAADGRLSTTPPKTTLAFPGGAHPDEAVPAIGWVHANCGACHNANTNAAASLVVKDHYFLVRASELAPSDGGAPAKLEELDLFKGAYCKETFRTEPGNDTPYLFLRGGEPSRSLMSVLSGRRVAAGQDPTPEQMPPIVTRAVDREGHALLDAWIQKLAPCP